MHQALVYGSTDELVSAAAPIVRESLERGDRVFASLASANIDALREELGADADRMTLHDTLDWAPRPADRLTEAMELVRALPAGTRLCSFGEPLWTGSDAGRREWARYESIINTVLADAPLRSVCVYDRSLPDDVLAHARCTHSELIDGSPARPSDTFTAPEEYLGRLSPGTRAEPGRDVRELAFGDDPHAFRASLAAIAGECGVDPRRIGDLVLAANEIAANAVVHGRPPVRSRTWTDGRELICEVADAGPGIHDPLAGWTVPRASEPGGWGLALSRRLCDAVEIVPHAAGNRVYLHVSLADRPAAAR